MPKVGVVLSGCGVMDGTEIHEAVIVMLALDRAGATIQCLAPDIEQMHVINHLSNEEAATERRNVLVEAARIARGEIRDMAAVTAEDLDACIFPGGYGAAKNLCTFAVQGAECTVHPDVAKLVLALHAGKKPMGFLCIAPAVGAAVFRRTDVHPTLTIGHDEATARALEGMGASHRACAVAECVVDERNRIVSTPAYMLGPRISHVAEGVEKLVAKVLSLID